MEGREAVDRDDLDALKMRDVNIQNKQLPVADKIWTFSLRIRREVINPKP
jgi:hypothetical protein